MCVDWDKSQILQKREGFVLLIFREMCPPYEGDTHQLGRPKDDC